jgi:hypothetical protein
VFIIKREDADLYLLEKTGDTLLLTKNVENAKIFTSRKEAEIEWLFAELLGMSFYTIIQTEK